jgi:hypothetical protein
MDGGGAGGAGGAGGTGGAGGVAGDLGIRCSGQIVTSSSPVTLATTIDCTPSYQKVSIGPRLAADEMYLAFTTDGVTVGNVQLATIGPKGVSVESTGVGANTALVIVDAADSPAIVGSEIFNQGVGYFVRSGATWQREMVSPIPATTYDFYSAWGARLGSDGQPLVLYAGFGSSSALQLATRSGPGTWSTTEIAAADAVPADLVIDSNGRANVIYQQPDTNPAPLTPRPALVDLPVGLPIRQIGGMWDTSYDLSAAAGLNGMVGAASVGHDGIRATFCDAQTAARDVPIPSTPLLTGTCSCTTGNCKFDGTTNAVALASTSDGAFWLAYAIDHIDRDITATMQGTTGPLGPKCQSTVTADRSTQEIVLVRLTTDGSAAPTTKWRFSTPLDSVGHIALVARGSRLMLAFSEDLIRTFTFDWAKL